MVSQAFTGPQDDSFNYLGPRANCPGDPKKETNPKGPSTQELGTWDVSSRNCTAGLGEYMLLGYWDGPVGSVNPKP